MAFCFFFIPLLQDFPYSPEHLQECFPLRFRIPCLKLNAIHDSDGKREYTPQNVRLHLLRQKSGVFNFGGLGSTADQETLGRLAGEVEQKLLQQGRLVYYYRNTGAEVSREVLRSLTESGIIVLTVKASPESAEYVKDLDPALSLYLLDGDKAVTVLNDSLTAAESTYVI